MGIGYKRNAWSKSQSVGRTERGIGERWHWSRIVCTSYLNGGGRVRQPTYASKQQKGRGVGKKTHVFLHIRPFFDPFLDALQVSQHPTHQVFSTNHNLLIEILEPARVADELCFRQSRLDLCYERVWDRWTREGGRSPWVEWARNKDKVGGSR